MYIPSVRCSLIKQTLNLFTMSVCQPCIQTDPIARCVTNLTIGTVTYVNTPVYVYIKDVTTDDRNIRYSVTTSPLGVVTIPITPQRFSEDHAYQIWVTLTTALNTSVSEKIIIGEFTEECVTLKFQTIWNNDNTIATYANQTLTPDICNTPNIMCTLFCGSVQLTAAQIRSLNTSPVLAIAAPGVGKFIDVMSASVKYTFGTVAFTNLFAHLSMKPSSPLNYLYFAGVFTNITSWFTQMADSHTTNNKGENLPVYVGSEADSAVGDGIATVYFSYRIVNI